jgi:phage repressor protein C with HTH and peptisase S24 domain
MAVERKQAEEALPISIILVPLERAKPFVTHLPVYSLAAAAGRFGHGQAVSEEGWVQVNGRRLDENMFVARVVGRSMEPMIPDGRSRVSGGLGGY